jgi:hypothetical protein
MQPAPFHPQLDIQRRLDFKVNFNLEMTLTLPARNGV